MNKQSGLTLLNLMTALVIVSIGLALTVPSLPQMAARNCFESHANDFVISLNLARTEAILRHKSVTVCPSTDGATCAAPGNWNRGWILTSGGTVLKVFPELSCNTSILAETGSTYDTSIVYGASGRATFPGNLVLCQGDNLITGRTVTVSATGRANINKNADHVGVLTTMFTACDGST